MGYIIHALAVRNGFQRVSRPRGHWLQWISVSSYLTHYQTRTYESVTETVFRSDPIPSE